MTPWETIMYLAENFLCKSALKVKFTRSFLTLWEPPWDLRKNIRRETLKMSFSQIDFDHPPWAVRPLPIYDFGTSMLTPWDPPMRAGQRTSVLFLLLWGLEFLAGVGRPLISISKIFGPVVGLPQLYLKLCTAQSRIRLLWRYPY